jgi:hypothetical protein
MNIYAPAAWALSIQKWEFEGLGKRVVSFQPPVLLELVSKVRFEILAQLPSAAKAG